MTSQERLQNQSQNAMPLLPGHVGIITNIKADEYCIDEHLVANKADSLLLELQLGDEVLCFPGKHHWYICQLLHRCDSDNPLTYQSQRPLHWQAPVVTLSASQHLNLVSGKRLSLWGEHVIVSACRSLIHTSSQLIQHVQQLTTQCKGLLQSSAKSQLMTAEEDVRIDGKRINMG